MSTPNQSASPAVPQVAAPAPAPVEPLSPSSPFLRFDEPPQFDEIRTEDVVKAIRALVARQEAGRARLESSLRPTWKDLVAPLYDLSEPLSFGWGIVHHLLSVKNSPALREAEAEVQPEVVASALALGQSRAFYDGFVALRASAEWPSLTPAQQRIIEASIVDAELAGVGLEGEKKQRFVAIETELAEAATTFSNHLLDATKAFALVLHDPAEVAGLPQSALAAAAQSARENAGEDARLAGASAEAGPWRVTLEGSLYIPFMEHSTRRDLRELLYRAYVTRASGAPHDNQPLLQKILRLRKQEAELLGFPSYAALGLRRKMAKEVKAARALLSELRAASRPHAQRELAELTAFARNESNASQNPSFALALWDVPFWAERLREQKYSYKEEELRDYFPLPAVLDGLFALARRLFGVVISAADGEVPVWHPDVRTFLVSDEDGAPRARFFLDPYSRPADKRGGAWVSGCIDRKRLASGKLRPPAAYVVCNQATPVDGKPSLMTFREVETLFHEFGHALQHMLTTVDEPGAAGSNNIEWDAVELPSQFMENWCYHRPTLLSFARHHASGVPLPEALFDKVAAARTYRAGSAFLRQIYFATLDLELHDAAFDPEKDDVAQLQARVAAENTVIAPLAEDRFLCGFSHIFAGGYAAGYYSYKWAEVLSADAFSAFEEAGLDNPEQLAATGRRFRDTVLAQGGSRPPAAVFEAFRGRPATTRALLVQAGLWPAQNG